MKAKGRPRVIRKVIKTDKQGRAKKVRDRKIGYDMERVKALGYRRCNSAACRMDKTIEPGTRYARITIIGQGRFSGGRLIPLTRDYHFECVLPECRPTLRFFTMTGAEK